MEVRLREAHLRDAPAISQLIVEHLDSIMVASEAENASVFLDSIKPQAISASLESGTHWYVLAVFEKEVVGLLGMRDPSHLFHLFVAKKAMGKGLSRQLFQAATTRAIKKFKIRGMTVNATPNAQEIYTHFGFRPTAPQRTQNGVAFTPMELDLT